jgi:hypothetical protein
MSKTPAHPPARPGPSELRRQMNESIRAAHRWFQRSLSREGAIAGLKTLAWLAPLTLLIWIYAEREQTDRVENQTIPIEVTAGNNPNLFVVLKEPSDKTVVAQLNGPKFRLEEMQKRISPRNQQASVVIPIDPGLSPAQEYPQEYPLDTATAILSSQVFADSGVTVTDCRPAKLHVFVDEFVERDAEVRAPESVTNLVGSPIFTPSMIRIRAPRSRFPATAPVVYADLTSGGLTERPGERKATVRVSSNVPGDNVTYSQNTVSADFAVRSLDQPEPKSIPSIAVTVDKPASFEKRFRVDCKPTLANVPVWGPRDQLDLLDKEPPNAVLEVRSVANAGTPQQAVLKFRFPDGAKDVRVDSVFANQAFEYTLVPLNPD